MKPRKIIVPIEIEKPDKKINDILYPKLTKEGAKFVRIKNEKEWKYGMIILKGGGITVNDLFAKIVDAKTKIESVKKLSNTLRVYLEKIKEFSIGNIVIIESSDDNDGFILKKYSNRPKMRSYNKLP